MNFQLFDFIALLILKFSDFFTKLTYSTASTSEIRGG